MPLLDATAAALTILTDSIAGPSDPANVDATIECAFSFAARPSSSITTEFYPVDST